MTPRTDLVADPMARAAGHWLAGLYERMDAGDLDSLRAVAAPEYRLRVLDLGVDIAGIEAVLAWMGARGRRSRHEVVSVVEDRAFVVATVRVDGAASRCHVYTRSSRGLLSCCVIAAAGTEADHDGDVPVGAPFDPAP